MLNRAIKIVNAAGYRLMLCQDHRSWSALALGENRTLNPSGQAMYTQAIEFGKTAEEALEKLVETLETRRLEAENDDLC